MSPEASKYIKYPLYPGPPTALERLMVKLGKGGPIRCTVCGSLAFMKRVMSNLRETCNCSACEATNRQRQMAFILCDALRRTRGGRVSSLKDIPKYQNLSIYNTESRGPVHGQLSGMKNYVSSEYFGDGYKSGATVKGKMHQDLMELSLDDASMDVVLSSDVFEHIPYPYKAHAEVYRVLKNKGRHIFTVPFYKTKFLDEHRTSIDADGNITHLLSPQHHGDPIRSEGALVHHIYALEMLVKLAEIGFRTNLYHVHNYWHGILGSGGIVFEAIKD